MQFSEETMQQVQRIAPLPFDEFKHELAAFGFAQLDDVFDCDISGIDHHLSPFVNAVLVTRYPFLYPRSDWDDHDLWDGDDAYSYTLFGSIPDGWAYRFGLDLCEDVRTILLRSQYADALEKYRIAQIKEKFGGLRWYDECIMDDVYEDMFLLTYLYEYLSYHVCIECGSMSDVRMTHGYILPICETCLVRQSNVNFDRDKFLEWYADENNIAVDDIDYFSIPFSARNKYMEHKALERTHKLKQTFTDDVLQYKVNGEPFDCISWARNLNLQIVRFFDA